MQSSVLSKEKQSFAQQLKAIWLAPSKEQALKRTDELTTAYERRFPKAIRCLEEELEDSLVFYAFHQLDARKISSANMLERLNREIRRRTNVVGIFPNPDAYTRLVTTYLMEYAEDWSASRAYLSEQSVQSLLQRALKFICGNLFCELLLTWPITLTQNFTSRLILEPFLPFRVWGTV